MEQALFLQPRPSRQVDPLLQFSLLRTLGCQFALPFLASGIPPPWLSSLDSEAFQLKDAASLYSDPAFSPSHLHQNGL